MSCGIVQVGRVDPVISYGTVANHVHKIAGAANIGLSSTYDSLQEAVCTSCTIQADKSAYWTPALYYQHADGTYEEVANTGMAVYYLGRGADANGNKVASPFPPGLKMLSGINTARTQDLAARTYGNSSYPSRLVSEAVSMACINYTPGMGSETRNLTNMDCPQGFRAQVHMQTCWDGKNLYLPDQLHVAHLSQIDNGICPPTHPVLLPHLFYEVFYSVNDFLGGGGRFVFANGDTTGYGFHGDFLNGWDTPTLTQAIDQCLIKNANGVVEDCPAFSASNNPKSAQICPERSPIFPCEQVKGRIHRLPGCITPTGYGHVVTSADITCPGGNAVSCNAAVASEPLAWTGDATYSPLGCYTEATSGRALAEKSTSSSNMTARGCKDYCYGYKFFGVEFGQECYCANAMNAGAVTAGPSECDMDCSGDRWEVCGGRSRLNMFQMNATLYKAPAVPEVWPGDALFSPIGCYTEATKGRALSSKSYSDGKNMTVEACRAFCGTSYAYFGVEWSQECYCGNQLNAGSVPASDSDCKNLCSGNKLQYCGGSSRLNVYKRDAAPTLTTTTSESNASEPSAISSLPTSSTSSKLVTSTSATSSAPSLPAMSSSASASVAAPSSSPIQTFSSKYRNPSSVGDSTMGVWAYQGCYTEATSGRALSSKQIYGSASNGDMDLEMCASFCFDSDYSFFGVEYGQQCYCGNSLGAGSVFAANQDECTTKCPGNSTQYCGAGKRLNLYSLVPGSGYDPATQFSTKYPEPLKLGNASVGIWNYTGCYTEATSGRALASAKLFGSSSTFSMTIERCVAFCYGKGYGLAGLEYGQECYCSDTLGAGSVWASQNDCSTQCPGNITQYCGAGGRLNLYTLLPSA